MATAILHPQHCRKLRFHPSHPPSPSPFNPRRNPNRKPNPTSNRPHRRNQTPAKSQPTGGYRSQGRDRSVVAKFPAKKLVMEQVMILKRGEDLKVRDRCRRRRSEVAGNDRRTADEEADLGLGLCSTDRLGPEPEMVQKQINVVVVDVDVDGMYAGSVSFASPPPSSLPFPAFFAKNEAATSDLRRLLRLDLF